MKNITFILVITGLFFASCENGDWEFPDFEYQAVYFAHQYPVRTITLGEDIFDTSMDNEGKFQIMATTGGVYENESNVTIDVQVNNGLANGLLFSGTGDQIVAMPENYYSLSSNQIIIRKGEIIGGVEVQLSDAFFNDPLAIQNAYVIPMVMTGVQNADSILSGTPIVENANRILASDWAVRPKDYVLYAVKYINEYHGYYLKRGIDEITGKNGNTALDTTVVRHEEFVEEDEVKMLSTAALNQIAYPLTYKDENENDINVTLILTFDEAGNCTVSSNSGTYTATGSGSFVKDGEEKSWGNQDRDALYLSYQVDLTDIVVDATDTLVMRNRGVTMETFDPVLQ